MAQLRLRVSNRHPTLGNGLFCLLELPVKLTADHAARLAAELNQREARAVDAVPFVGAWTGSDATPPSFVCFLPNCCYHPGTAEVIASWVSVRASMVGEWVGGLPAPLKKPRGAKRDRKKSAG